MKHFILGVLGVFAVLFTIGLIASFNNQPITKIENTKDAFIVGCTSEGASRAFCSCSYNQLETKFGEIGIARMNVELLETGEVPEAAINAIEQCISLY